MENTAAQWAINHAFASENKGKKLIINLFRQGQIELSAFRVIKDSPSLASIYYNCTLPSRRKAPRARENDALINE